MSITALSCIIIITTSILGVLYHEYGHLKLAKRNQIAVNTFCIGFGKPFISRKGKDGTTYGIALFPLGGYCVLDNDALNKSPLHVYIYVLLAGIIRNIILGAVLIVVGQLFIAKGFISPVILIENAMKCFGDLLNSIGDTIKNMFSLQTMASSGGFVTQLADTSKTIAATSETISRAVGISFMMGGLINYMFAILNVLPVPGLDGGQVAVRLIHLFCKKVFHYEINQNIIGVINVAAIVVLSCYQGLLLLFDIPCVRDLFLIL